MTRAVVAPPVGFRRLSLTGWGLFFFAVSASAPMTVLVGGIVGAFAVTGVVEVPAAFALLTALLLLVWVGHVGMARHVRHSGPLYAHVARGLGPVPALGAVPDVIDDPAIVMLWGITRENLDQWLDDGSEDTNELKGFAACSGVVEGPAASRSG